MFKPLKMQRPNYYLRNIIKVDVHLYYTLYLLASALSNKRTINFIPSPIISSYAARYHLDTPFFNLLLIPAFLCIPFPSAFFVPALSLFRS